MLNLISAIPIFSSQTVINCSNSIDKAIDNIAIKNITILSAPWREQMVKRDWGILFFVFLPANRDSIARETGMREQLEVPVHASSTVFNYMEYGLVEPYSVHMKMPTRNKRKFSSQRFVRELLNGAGFPKSKKFRVKQIDGRLVVRFK
jgi:hypothetical protein